VPVSARMGLTWSAPDAQIELMAPPSTGIIAPVM
jgi:hypothetical protein